jgi:hypothetical protein
LPNYPSQEWFSPWIGVLLGAGDAAFMRTATVVNALASFLPLVWLSLVCDWGWPASGRGSAFIVLD